MSEIKIGFEYEGLKNCYYEYFWKNQLELPAIQRTSTFDEVGLLYNVKDNEALNDGYSALAELRFKPFSPDDNLDNLFYHYCRLIDRIKVLKNGIVFGEKLVSEEAHRYSIENLEKSLVSLEIDETRNFTGQRINYNFKEPMTFDEKGLPIPYKKPEDISLYRGGGLHINISPVKPKQAPNFIKALHERLYPQYKEFNFQSNYRKHLLFRYRIYNGVPGVEYMSYGLNYSTPEDFISRLKFIVQSVTDLIKNI